MIHLTKGHTQINKVPVNIYKKRKVHMKGFEILLNDGSSIEGNEETISIHDVNTYDNIVLKRNLGDSLLKWLIFQDSLYDIEMSSIEGTYNTVETTVDNMSGHIMHNYIKHKYNGIKISINDIKDVFVITDTNNKIKLRTLGLKERALGDKGTVFYDKNISICENNESIVLFVDKKDNEE